MIDQIVKLFSDTAIAFGAVPEKDFVLRNNTKPDALNDNGAYFALIHPDEERSGPYHDFSVVMFPSDTDQDWLLSLGVGSFGFKNDYELATHPGLRRLFSKLVDENGFVKSDFADIETNLPKQFINRTELQPIKNTLSKYTKVLPVCQILSAPLDETSQQRIQGFIAAYAKVRGWPTNAHQRNAVSKALSTFTERATISDASLVDALLKTRKFVVLQGAPGTGKTTLAKKIAHKNAKHIFFTQFHAETNYTDFVFGIQPDVESEQLRYIGRDGIFVSAVQAALNHPEDNVVLIIDEINRANLANVIGPAFYLFEYQMHLSDIEIALTPSLSINKLPSNLFVIATMNTSDRSLAVVDFALRRRFAWYTLKPTIIKDSRFHLNDFSIIDEIFNWFANSQELNLQPGQGYFIADNDDAMKDRVRYEIYPLIKEYLMEGLLQNAKEELNDYFLNRIQLPLFE